MASTIAPPSHGTPAGGTPPTAPAHSGKQPTFEFTRRKRWAELLVNELSEAITLVLSPLGTVLFCGPAVTELLGWRDEELIDTDLLGLVNADDQAAFRQTLADAIQAHTDLVTYVRLRCKAPAPAQHPPPPLDAVHAAARDPAGDYGYAIPTASTSAAVPPQPPAQTGTKEVLFELTGYPHFVDPDEHEERELAQRGLPPVPECKVVFAVAKPYPSRNTAMLNTFLELKVENERLQQRIRAGPPHASPRRASVGAYAQAAPHPSLSPTTPHPYAQAPGPGGFGSMPVSMAMPVSQLAGAGYVPPQGAGGYAPPFYPPPQGVGYADYAVGLGAGAGYAFPGPAGAPPQASGLVALASVATDHRRMSLSGPAGATEHRRMSLPGGGGDPSPVREGGGARDRDRDRSDDGEDGGKKKKARRHVGEQFVCRTCGRTDSPEWRKGPLGPKTLCNACGLRWAKQVRKGEDKDEPGAGGE